MTFLRYRINCILIYEILKTKVHEVCFTLVILVQSTKSYLISQFTLDEKAEYAIVSTSGINVDLKITTDKSYWSPQPTLQSTMWNANGKVCISFILFNFRIEMYNVSTSLMAVGILQQF